MLKLVLRVHCDRPVSGTFSNSCISLTTEHKYTPYAHRVTTPALKQLLFPLLITSLLPCTSASATLPQQKAIAGLARRLQQSSQGSELQSNVTFHSKPVVPRETVQDCKPILDPSHSGDGEALPSGKFIGAQECLGGLDGYCVRQANKAAVPPPPKSLCLSTIVRIPTPLGGYLTVLWQSTSMEAEPRSIRGQWSALTRLGRGVFVAARRSSYSALRVPWSHI